MMAPVNDPSFQRRAGTRTWGEDANPEHRPYALWLDTLPDGREGKVFIWPRVGGVGVILHVDRQLRHGEEQPTVEEAERLGWEWHETLNGRLT